MNWSLVWLYTVVSIVFTAVQFTVEGFSHCSVCWRAFSSRTEAFKDFNCSSAVSWRVGLKNIKKYFTQVDFPRKMKIERALAAKLIILSNIFRNSRVCSYGWQSASFFDIQPPPLEMYFSITHQTYLFSVRWICVARKSNILDCMVVLMRFFSAASTARSYTLCTPFSSRNMRHDVSSQSPKTTAFSPSKRRSFVFIRLVCCDA